MKNTVKCFLDLEFNLSDSTKYTSRNNMEIVSIGAIIIDANYNEVERFYSVIKPKYNINIGKYYEQLTNLHQSDINSAKSFTKVFNDFELVLSKYNMVRLFTWGNEDLKMLKHDIFINHYNGDFKHRLSMINNIQPVISSSIKFNNEIIRKQWSLMDMHHLLNTKEYETHHNALTDAIMLKDIYIAYKEKTAVNQEYLQPFVERHNAEKKKRLDLLQQALNDFYYPSREYHFSLKPDSFGIHRTFLQKYKCAHNISKKCNQVIVSIDIDSVTFTYFNKEKILVSLIIPLTINNFSKIRRYILTLEKKQERC